jgi:hypothetical protein
MIVTNFVVSKTIVLLKPQPFWSFSKRQPCPSERLRSLLNYSVLNINFILILIMCTLICCRAMSGQKWMIEP